MLMRTSCLSMLLYILMSERRAFAAALFIICFKQKPQRRWKPKKESRLRKQADGIRAKPNAAESGQCPVAS